MWKTILRRVLLMIPQVIILSVLIFLLAQAMPGGSIYRFDQSKSGSGSDRTDATSSWLE